MIETAYYDIWSQGSKGDIHKLTGFILGSPEKQMTKKQR